MSTPLDRDLGPDEPSPYAPKWVRNAECHGQRAISSRAHGLIEQPEFPEASPAAPSDAGDGAYIDQYRVPRSLEPTLIPEAWLPRRRLHVGTLVRFALAVTVTATAALFVTGELPNPSTMAVANNSDNDAPSFSSRFSGQSSNDVQWSQSRHSSVKQEPPRSQVFPHTVTVANSIRGAGVVVQSRGYAIRQLDRQEIVDLIRRGDEFFVAGDLASARLVLQRAAEARDPRAALMLAGTYDPIVLEKLGIQGIAADIILARSWYERAKEFGSAEASRYLERLTSR